MIPAFNAAAFITEAIESVVKQAYRPMELVVVDDGSTDTTVSLVNQCFQSTGGLPTSLVEIGRNAGAANALSVGFSAATGQFVSWLSADDVFIDANKTGLQAAAMTKRDADWSYFKHFYSGPDPGSSRLVRPDSPPWRGLFGYLFERHPAFRVLGLLYQNPINGSSTMIRKSSIERFGQFDPTLRNVDADGDLWMRYSVLGAKVVAVDGAPVFYRTHPQQTSQKGPSMVRGMELTRLRILTALSSLGALEKMISDNSNMLAFMLARSHLAEEAPFTTSFLCGKVLERPATSNLALRSVAKRALGRSRRFIESHRLDQTAMMNDVAASSRSKTFQEFLEVAQSTKSSLLYRKRGAVSGSEGPA